MVNKAPAGRRPGESGAREAILAAARQRFAERGFAGATLRAIAAEAGVDPALLLHYFGSKRGLFTAASQMPISGADIVARLAGGGPVGAGERLLRFLLAVWGNEGSRDMLLGLIRAAVEDEPAAEMLRTRLGSQLIGPFAGALVAGEAELRVSLVASQMIGLALARYVIQIEPLASLPADDLVAAVAPTIQRYLTGDLQLPPKDPPHA
jgi:AcrR family transcriptional regulator